MQVMVTVFKSEFIGKESTKEILSALTASTSEVESAMIFIPKAGKLMELLTLLSDRKIVYRTHFDTMEGTAPTK
jgi:hypothetical protein